MAEIKRDTGLEVQLEIAKNIVNDATLITGQGISGTFTAGCGCVITVIDGVMTNIAAPVLPPSVGVNFCNGPADGDGGVPPAFYYGQNGNWNNLNSFSGNLITPPMIDNLGAMSPITVDLNNTPPDVWGFLFPGQVYGVGPVKFGQWYPGNVPSIPGELAYGGVGGTPDGGGPPVIQLIVSNIPYANWKVDLAMGWYENNVTWVSFTGAGPWSGVDNTVGNTYNASRTANTFTFDGGEGHSVFAVQIIQV